MATISGNYFDGQQARSQPVQIQLAEDGMLHPTPALFAPVSINAVKLDPPLGKLDRVMRFPSGAVVETADHDQLAQWFSASDSNHSWVYRLENSWRHVLVALMLMVLVVFWITKYGIPMMSAPIAAALPEEANDFISEGAMQTLDARFFAPSTLSQSRQSAIRNAFFELLPKEQSADAYQLEFRAGEKMGANAFALPDGTVVITDELIEITEQDEEILAILLHEIGHVEHRHSLQQVIRHSSLAALSMLVLGDVSAAGAVIYALPSILMNSSYSREFEWEADGYALEQMHAHGFDPIHFANAMRKLEAYALEQIASSEDEQNQEKATEQTVQIDSTHSEAPEVDQEEDLFMRWMRYLDSHPATADRVARFEAEAHGH